MANNRDWLRTWVEKETRDRPLTEQAKERALDVAEAAFKGNTGVGTAARIGVEAVEKEIYKNPKGR